MLALKVQGGSKLNVFDLCAKLGVTKGSFYAHFEDRADFVERFLAYWAETFIQSVFNAISELEDPVPEGHLLALMRLLHHERMARHDVAVRAWAAQEPKVAKAVRKVDARRFEYIRQIFHDIGFRGTELDLQTRIFVVYHSSNEGMQHPPSGSDVDEEIRLKHAFFVRA